MIFNFFEKIFKRKELGVLEDAYIKYLYKLGGFTINFFKGFIIGAVVMFLINIIFSRNFDYASTIFIRSISAGVIALITMSIVGPIILYFLYKKEKERVE